MPRTPRASSHGASAAAICLLLFFLLARPTIAASSVSSAQMFNGSCVAAEREALLSFKAGITSDPSRRLRSWRGQDCCRWYGVRCSTMTGHVETLNLHNDFFMDDLFVIEQQDDLSSSEHGVRWLRGHISSSLLALSHLKHLDLGGNVLGGSMPMPPFLCSLKSLTYLDLSNMNFSGQVPPQLGNLTKLVYLDIHNDFVLYAYEFAYTYSSDVSWLARLDSLEYLDMSCVDLSTSVDWIHSVNTLPMLRVLYLYNCQLNSSIPSLLHNNLTVLEELDLTFNSFDSPATPNWYWDITSLKMLGIRGCGLSGPFPDELGNITMLEILDMRANNIKGMVPSTMKHLCSLQMVDLSRNNIDGDITDLIKSLPNCSWNSLQELDLSEANITGTTLQWMLNLTTLSVLDISNNDLSGSVPVEIGTLKNLTDLYIGHNSLSGVISDDHFTGLMNLENIDLSHTYLQLKVGSDWKPPFNLESASFSYCHLGPQFPNWLRWQSNMVVLEMSNVGLAGRIPDWFWTTFSKSKHLDLSYNKISGVLPLNLEFMLVRQLFLQSNDLTGSVPQLPRNIMLLDISQNSFNGQLQSNFGVPYLRVALLFSNNITGTIPKSICGLPQLQVLDLSDNFLTGGLPDCQQGELKQRDTSSKNSSRVNYASSYSLEMHTLLLYNNSLTGGFPLFLKQCQNLMFLDLTQNRFSGELPMWINELPQLVMLRLRSNNFFGHIPIETTMLFSLRILDLANNTFSGVIPQSIVNLKGLTTPVVDLDSTDNPFEQNYRTGYVSFMSGLYNDSLSLIIKGQALDYRENAVFVMSIDLSSNKLTGEIPEEIGSLIGLINLNLSSNLLSGNIPYKIGNLQSLESLDLSNNQLSGQIPLSMSNLTSLSYLNLSYNNLSGKIPSGHQLDTLKADDPASMYIGNPSLCGYPLPKVCPGDQPIQEDPFKRKQDDMSQIYFHLGLIVGFLVGIWTVFVAFLFKKAWRFTYFSLFDKFYDRVQVFFVVTWRQWFKETETN